MQIEDHEARMTALRRALANPNVQGELRTRLERLLRLAAERVMLRGAMAKQGARAGTATGAEIAPGANHRPKSSSK